MRTSSSHLVWLLMLGVAVVGSNAFALSPILSDVAAELDASVAAITRANAAYGGATALSAITLGRVIDRFGPERVLTLGLAVLACAMLASAVATHWAWLALAQAVAGAAAGAVLPSTYALATAVAPEGRSAETLGRVLTGWSISLVAGVPLSSYIASAFSWRASYVLFAVLLLLAAVLLSRRRIETAVAGPKTTLRDALSRPRVVPLLLVCLLFMTPFYGTYAIIGDHLRKLLGLSATEAGIVVLVYGAGFGVASFGDRAVDRIGARRLFPFILASVALVFVAMIPAAGVFAAILVVVGLWGFADHFALNILVLQLTRAAPDSRGAVLSLNSAASYAGALFGAWLFGMLYEGAGFDAVAVVAAVITAVGALVAFVQTRSPEREGRPAAATCEPVS